MSLPWSWGSTAAVVGAIVLTAVTTVLLLPPAPTIVQSGERITGLVTIVDADGTSLCLTGDADGEQHCSEIFLPPSAPAIRVGERIAVTSVIIAGTDGVHQEVFLVTDRDSD